MSENRQDKTPGTLSICSCVIVFLLLLFAVFLFSVYRLSRHANPAEIFVFRNHIISSGNTVSFLVFLRDGRTLEPLKNETVDIGVEKDGKTLPLCLGKTGEDGVALVKLDKMPAGPDFTLKVMAKGMSCNAKFVRRVSYECSISSDKPLYRPGGTVKVRALVMEAMTRKPLASRNLNVEIFANGNKLLFSKYAMTSEFGIASTDFMLPDKIMPGSYRIKVSDNGTPLEEKEFYVGNYKQSAFSITSSIDNHFIFPGIPLSGNLCVKSSDGKPMQNAQVTIKLFNEYMERVQQLIFVGIFNSGRDSFTMEKREALALQVNGKTGEDGIYKFEIPVSEKLRNAKIEEGIKCRIEISVTDSVTTVTENKELLATLNPVSVSFIPENQYALPGIENKFFIRALYPDGSPAKVNLRIRNDDYCTDENGLAELVLKANDSPSCLRVKIEDQADKISLIENVNLPFDDNPLLFVVKTDRELYFSGEELELEVLANADSGKYYLDMETRGTTFLLSQIKVKERRGQLKLKLPDDIYGTLSLHVYRILPEGQLLQTRRVIQVQKKDQPLNIAASFDKSSDSVTAAFKVTDCYGRPVRAALSVAAYGTMYMPKGFSCFSDRNFLISEEQFKEPFREEAVAIAEGKKTDGLFSRYVFTNICQPRYLPCMRSESYSEQERKLIRDKIDYGESLFQILFSVFIIIYFAMLAVFFFRVVSNKSKASLILAENLRVDVFRAGGGFIFAFLAGTMSSLLLSIFLIWNTISENFLVLLWAWSSFMSIAFALWMLIPFKKIRRSCGPSNPAYRLLNIVFLMAGLNFVIFSALDCAIYFFPNTPHLLLMALTQFVLLFATAVCLLLMRERMISDENAVSGVPYFTNLGAGMGRRKRKAFVWMLMGVLYAWPVLLMYIIIPLTIISLFLPLFFVCEKLGSCDGYVGARSRISWLDFANRKKTEYFSVSKKGAYFESPDYMPCRKENVPKVNFFPDTLSWQPELVTDGEGRASLAFKVDEPVGECMFQGEAVGGDGSLGGFSCDLKSSNNKRSLEK